MSDFHVAICTPSTGHCRTSFAFSLARLTGYLAQRKPRPELNTWSFDFLMLESSGISTNREKLTRQALSLTEMTHVLWLDDDMGFGHDVLHLLARWRQPIVGCNYRMRAPPGQFTAVRGDMVGRIETTPDSTGIEPAAYTGFGCCLIERRVLEAVPEPRYPLFWSEAHQDYSTEDVPFFEAARKLGFPVYVDHDASKRIWHCGNLNYVWDQDYSKLTSIVGIARNEDMKPDTIGFARQHDALVKEAAAEIAATTK